MGEKVKTAPGCPNHKEGLSTGREIICWCKAFTKSGKPGAVFKDGQYSSAIEKVCKKKTSERYLYFTKGGEK